MDIQKQKQSYEIGSLLISEKIVYEIRYYVDHKKLWDKYNALTSNCRCNEEILTLLNLISGPICLDKIEGKLSSDRRDVREHVFSLGKEIYRYYESNKLNSSVLVYMLMYIEFIIDQGYILSQKLSSRLDCIKKDLSGGNKDYRVFRYRANLDNAGRLVVVYQVQSFVEDFLTDIFEQIEKEKK